MDETLYTYRFLAFGEKTPSLLFMLHKEENSCFVKTSQLYKHMIPSFAIELTKLYFLAYFVP
jgi:hypothetical protein